MRIALDGSGNAYVTGYTDSSNFPTQNPYQGTRLGSTDAFVTKLDTCTSVLYVNKDDGTCGGKSPCYTSIQAAIDAACTDSSIMISQGTYDETLVLNESKSLTLQGGWDSTFTTISGRSTVNKTTIGKGEARLNKGSLGIVGTGN